jgi:N-acetylmuramoyl-L-alanine amidase
MPTIHIVQQHEYLASIARAYGMNWETIYQHPENAEFRRQRPNPNVIRPGDRIVIPDKEERTCTCATGRRHTFTLRQTATVLVRIVIRDDEGKPLANEPYVLEIGETEYAGATDERGLLEKPIAIGATSGNLRLTNRHVTMPLAIGHLDPVETQEEFWRGVQARLNNLGYFCGAVDNVNGPLTRAAIRAFQQQVLGRTDADGVVDTETRDALVREHGC